ncbi:hypothetical protein EV175_001286 [Coemansia sp. RSA 1933]|nr:hypothetical protein EV175_001286 [Coemansia sp. RSA 1933]
MWGVTLYRFLAVALLALLCLASPSLAQNDNSGSSTNASTENTPTPSSDTANTAAASRSSDDGSTSSATNSSGGSSSNDPTPTDSNDSSEEISDDSSDDTSDDTGVQGTVSLLTPDSQTIPTPMFAIGEQIVLGWNYSSDTTHPPEKLSICGRFPTDSSASTDASELCNWYIAQNISGSLRNYTWDTVTEGAPGVAFFEDTGYMMYFFDSDYGVSNSSPGAGRITPSLFRFAMYRSRYGETNDGVPAGYNPSAATAVAIHAWTVAVGLALSVASLLVLLALLQHCALADDSKDSGTANKGSGDDKNDRDLTLNVGGDSPTATTGNSDNGSGISLNNNASPSKTSSSKSPSSTSSSNASSNGQPGRIVMKTPPQSVESPLFEINSMVKLQWGYDNNMKKAPSRVTLRGQMPDGFYQPGTTKPLYWYIGQNVSAENMAYTWDTITESPPGYTLREGSGYKLFIYDSDIGWDNSTHVYPGRLFQFMLPFSMYNSRYDQTNDGVPSNYNPNSASHFASTAVALWTATLVSVLVAFGGALG